LPHRFRLTRRFAAAMSEDGYRRLRNFAQDAGLERDEALSFLCAHLDQITDDAAVQAQLRRFRATLEARQT